MKRIATKTSRKGKKSVTLIVYSCENILIYDDNEINYHKVLHINSFQDAHLRFHEWVLQMYNIKTNIQLG